MVASAQAISGSSAAGRLLRICLPENNHASTPGKVQTSCRAPLTTRTILGVGYGVPGCTGGACIAGVRVQGCELGTEATVGAQVTF